MSNAMKYYNQFELESILKCENANFDNFYKYELVEMLNIARRLINSDDKLTYEQGYTAGFSHNVKTVEKLEKENKQLKEQLKQRDEVIDECIESIQNFMTRIDEGFCADMMTFIDILQKYKGDNNG